MKRSLAWFAGTILVTWLLVLVPELTVGQTTPNLAESEQLLEVEELNQQARELYNQGQFAAALEAFEDALIIVRELPVSAMKRQQEGDILYKMGESYNQLSQYRQAADSYEQALSIYQELNSWQKQGNSLNWLGLIYEQLGEYKRSLDSYEEALAINQELGNHHEAMLILNNRALLYNQIGQYEESLASLLQAWEILQDNFQLAVEAVISHNLGDVYSYLNQESEARKFYGRALGISRVTGNRRQEAITLSNIGLLYSQQQQYSQALDFLQASRKIEQELGNRQSEGISIYSIAGIYLNQGKYEQALELLEESLAISRKQDDPVWVARIIERMGLTLLKSGKLTAATEKLLAAIEVWESLRPGLSDQERVSLFDKRAQTYGYLQQALLAQNEIEAALEIAERGRSRALAELLAQRLSNVPEGQVGIKPTTIEEIKQIASQQQATLVEYSVIEDTLLIWVVKPSGEVFVEKVNLPPLKTSLENLVTSARKAIGVRGRGSIAAVARGNSGSTSDLEQLYQVLISPIAQFLPTNPEERVIFIPHQQLFLVPFPALVDSSGKYLIEKHTILTAPAIQVLQLISSPVEHLHFGGNKAGGRRQEAVSMKKIFTTMHENPSLRVSASPRPRVSFQSEPTPNPYQEGDKRQEVLVVGNPTMPSVGIPPQQLSPLPGAEVEAYAIAQLLQTSALTGNQATETVVKQKMNSARIIHLATHGLLDDFGYGIPGAIALTPSAEDDGLLSAGEIFEMQLNAELVVLSACDTGQGKITGDGVIGLSRSFLAAGVSNLIVSLWSVPDAPTAQLMQEFYLNWQLSGDKAQALRQAMLTTRKQYPDPKDWGAFTLIGVLQENTKSQS
ncbi:MAG: CHAT domain-containing protein [Symploca sp. SIO1B1]|nr:CHAT domain-containing protein [Symploca sp. SIO1B1]